YGHGQSAKNAIAPPAETAKLLPQRVMRRVPENAWVEAGALGGRGQIAEMPRDRFLEAFDPSDGTGSIAVVFRSGNDERGRQQRRVGNRFGEVEAALRSAGRDERRGDFGKRRDPEGQLGNDAERAERSDEELREVVPGDVLHHLTAGFDLLAGRENHFHADYEIAHTAVKRPARTVDIRRGDAAERGLGRPRRIDGQELAPLGQQVPEGRSGNTGFGGRGEIGVVVLDEAREPVQFENDIHSLRNISETHERAAAPWEDRRAGFGANAQDRADFLRSKNLTENFRHLTVDGMAVDERRVGADRVGTGLAGERRRERIGGNFHAAPYARSRRSMR